MVCHTDFIYFGTARGLMSTVSEDDPGTPNLGKVSSAISPTVAALLAATDAAIEESRNWKDDLNKSFAADGLEDDSVDNDRGEDGSLNFCIEDELFSFQNRSIEHRDEGIASVPSSYHPPAFSFPVLALAPEVARALEKGQLLQLRKQRHTSPRDRKVRTSPALMQHGDENVCQNGQSA